MSIVKAINELSGKEAVTIEDAIRNVDISGGGDKGYECTKTRTLLTDETCTFEALGTYQGASLSYSDFIDADELFVTFDSVKYGPISKGVAGEGAYYGDINIAEGAVNFDRFPFVIASSRQGSVSAHTMVYAETGGEHTIKIEAIETVATTTLCFEKAVHSVTAPLMINFMEADAETGNIYFDKTFGEVTNAYLKGRPCILNYNLEGADYSGFFSAAAILNEGKDPARIIFLRGIESIVLYANSDTGRLYGKEKGMR